MVSQYGKYPKISNTLFHTHFAEILLFMQLFLKILSEKANSADPDQTAPSSGPALFAHAILLATLVYKSLGHLLYLG